jgi:hypothetical protein
MDLLHRGLQAQFAESKTRAELLAGQSDHISVASLAATDAYRPNAVDCALSLAGDDIWSFDQVWLLQNLLKKKGWESGSATTGLAHTQRGESCQRGIVC